MNLKRQASTFDSKSTDVNDNRCGASTPCTLDTAYSSMKQSPSPSSSIGIDPDYDELINASRIKSFLQSAESDADMIEADSASNREDSKERSPVTSHSLSDEPTTDEPVRLWGVMLREKMLQLTGNREFLYEDNWANFNDAAASVKYHYTQKIAIRKRKVSSSGDEGSRRAVKNARTSSTANASPQNKPLRVSQRRSMALKKAEETILEESKLPAKEDEEKPAAKQPKESTKKNVDEIIESFILKNRPANFILRDAPKEVVCEVCLKPNHVIRCSGSCGGNFHRECRNGSLDYNGGLGPKNWYANLKDRIASSERTPTIDLVTGEDFVSPSTLCENLDSTALTCNNCSSNRTPSCSVCHKDDGEQVRCCERQCGQAYHLKCLKYWPQNKLNFTNSKSFSSKVKSIRCPRHVCHTCISDNPQALYTNVENSKKLIRCVLCPGTYHRVSTCIPAGSEILSECQIVCPRHRRNTRKPANIDWCFLCAKFGKLLCCETCPGSFHPDCLNIPTDDRYICEECESGRLPLYGEIVWSKYSTCNWWPGITVSPPMIPPNVAAQKPGANYICIYFFGTYNYGWLCRDYMYLFDEGDAGDAGCKIPSSEGRLIKARDDANKWYKIIKTMQQKYCSKQNSKPRPYTRIQVNHYVPPAKHEMDDDVEDECECDVLDGPPCSEQSNCINYELQIECKPTCNTGIFCMNQRFEKRKYVPFEVTFLESKGWGVIAKETIPPNTFVIEYVGEIIVSAEFHLRHQQAVERKQENFYFLTLGNGQYIDAEFKGNAARFINHSCDPNCVPQKWKVNQQTRIGLFSQRTIPAVSSGRGAPVPRKLILFSRSHRARRSPSITTGATFLATKQFAFAKQQIVPVSLALRRRYEIKEINSYF